MYKVKVIDVGVKLANKWCFIGDEAIIDKKEYENNKEYVEIIEVLEEPSGDENQNTQDNDENAPKDENVDNIENNEDNNENTPENDSDEELDALKERAKELGINVTHNMKKETIIKKIEEATENEPSGDENQNPIGE